MSVWKSKVMVEDLNKRCENTLGQNLGIEFTEIGDDHLGATMPVNYRTVHPEQRSKDMLRDRLTLK